MTITLETAVIGILLLIPFFVCLFLINIRCFRWQEPRFRHGGKAIAAGVILVVGGFAASTLMVKDSGPYGGPLEGRAKRDLLSILHAAEWFQAETGRYPTRIEEMSVEGSKKAGTSLAIGIGNDPWGRPYIYRLVDGKPRVACLGRDGVPGGTGLDADVEEMTEGDR
jgi:general secretion pathway protein G